MQKNALLVEMVNGLETIKGGHGGKPDAPPVGTGCGRFRPRFRHVAPLYHPGDHAVLQPGPAGHRGHDRLGGLSHRGRQAHHGRARRLQHSGGPGHVPAHAALVNAQPLAAVTHGAQGPRHADGHPLGKRRGRFPGQRRDAGPAAESGRRELQLSRLAADLAGRHFAEHPARRARRHHWARGIGQIHGREAAHRPVSAGPRAPCASAAWTSAS